MELGFEKEIKRATGAIQFREIEVIQSLWSGYGEIVRLELDDGNKPSVIMKFIDLSSQTNHPRGWNTDSSHNRKVKSYQIESHFYQTYSAELKGICKVPDCLTTKSIQHQHIILLEDLDVTGYPIRKHHLNLNEVKLVLKWLAKFHAAFLGQNPEGLWEEGSYWHLATREEEWNKMKSGTLKEAASWISDALKNTQFQTYIHGDAKVANFCFSTDSKHVAAVDFQYVGGGCGMKDVAYFVGSCLTEEECELWETEILNYYFEQLKLSVQLNEMEFVRLESDWRDLYCFAWADFTRFLMGWMPTHQKLNSYSEQMVNHVFEIYKTKNNDK